MSIRHASGISPEELSLLEAGIEGQRAGVLGTAAGLNPYFPGTPEASEWETKRRAAEASFLAEFSEFVRG